MTTTKVCYFTVIGGDAPDSRIRYGFDVRTACQIEVSHERWTGISAQLRYQGFELIERREEACNGRCG